MSSGDWLTVAMGIIGALGALMMSLIAVVAYFLKRMVDQFDTTRASVFALRNELHAMHSKFKLFKFEMRVLLSKLGVDVPKLMSEYEDENGHPAPEPEHDLTL